MHVIRHLTAKLLHIMKLIPKTQVYFPETYQITCIVPCIMCNHSQCKRGDKPLASSFCTEAEEVRNSVTQPTQQRHQVMVTHWISHFPWVNEMRRELWMVTWLLAGSAHPLLIRISSHTEQWSRSLFTQCSLSSHNLCSVCALTRTHSHSVISFGTLSSLFVLCTHSFAKLSYFVLFVHEHLWLQSLIS